MRYDTPEFGGFVASAAWGEDDFWDVALRYAGEHGGFKFAGGIGYSAWTGQGSLNDRGCSIAKGAANLNIQYTDGKSECETLGLSASIQHVETGLYFTGAYGIKWDDNREASFKAVVRLDGQDRRQRQLLLADGWRRAEVRPTRQARQDNHLRRV